MLKKLDKNSIHVEPLHNKCLIQRYISCFASKTSKSLGNIDSYDFSGYPKTCKFIEKETQWQVVSCEFDGVLYFLKNNLRTTASVLVKYLKSYVFKKILTFFQIDKINIS